MNKNLTLEEIHKMKLLLEDEVSKLLSEFHKQTGLWNIRISNDVAWHREDSVVKEYMYPTQLEIKSLDTHGVEF